MFALFLTRRFCRMNFLSVAILSLLVLLHGNSVLTAQDALAKNDADAKVAADAAQLIEQFKQTMDGSQLVGSFTIDGRDMNLKPERYEIRSVTKLEEGDFWLFKSRIKYGDHDVTVPIPIEVKWAGNTPVLTVDNLTIPGMGTFDARVVIFDGKYAGTWRHGEVGGLLFGKVEKLADADAKSTDDGK